MSLNLLLFLLLLFFKGIYSQNTNVTLLKYCLMHEGTTGLFRFKNFIDITTMLQSDSLTMGSNKGPNTNEANSNYGGSVPGNIIWYDYISPTIYIKSTLPCLIGYTIQVPNSILICEALSSTGNVGYFYFICSDVTAISWLQSVRATSFKALGYFLTYLPNDLLYAYNRLYLSTCQPSNEGLLPYFELQFTVDYKADFVGPNNACPINTVYQDITLYGLADWPTISQVSTNIQSTTINPVFERLYYIDNTLNNNIVSFTLGDILTTSLTKNYQTVASQSSTSSMTHGFTVSFQETYGSEAGSSEGAKVSWQVQLTQTEQSQWTMSQTSDNSQSYSTGYTVTENIMLSGTINIQPHCNLTIIEIYSNVTDIYLQQFLFNSFPSYTTYSVTTISPIGYKYISSNC